MAAFPVAPAMEEEDCGVVIHTRLAQRKYAHHVAEQGWQVGVLHAEAADMSR